MKPSKNTGSKTNNYQVATAELQAAPALQGEHLGRLVAYAALRECGQLAINHAQVAGCQLNGPPTSRCDIVGMDRVGGFDCSGLSRYATFSALRPSGFDLTELTSSRPEWRHVRQLATLAERDFLLSDLVPGTHLLFERQYDIGGQRMIVPGHMGIIIGRRPDGNFDFVQTVQSRRRVAKTAWRPDRPGAACRPWGIIPAHKLAHAILEAS